MWTTNHKLIQYNKYSTKYTHNHNKIKYHTAIFNMLFRHKVMIVGIEF